MANMDLLLETAAERKGRGDRKTDKKGGKRRRTTTAALSLLRAPARRRGTNARALVRFAVGVLAWTYAASAGLRIKPPAAPRAGLPQQAAVIADAAALRRAQDSSPDARRPTHGPHAP